MRVFYRIILSGVLLIVLSACDKSDYTVENPDKEQMFHIINTAFLFEKYIEKGAEANFEMYNNEVIQPIYDDCFKDGEFLYMADEILHTAPTNLSNLKNNTELMKVRQQELNQLIEEALLKSAKLLPSDKDVTVCLVPATSSGIRLFTTGAGKIIIPYNEFIDDAFLKVSIAHEYHHSTWAEHNVHNETFTILDNLVFEGKAVMFEQLVYPEISTIPIDPTYNKDNWSKIEKDLNSIDFNRSLAIINGGNDLPALYGYSEGFKIVQAYLKQYPEKTPEEWTALSPTEIFRKGNYTEHYE